MAMNLRLPEELDRNLEAISRARHASKHAMLIEAVERFVRTESKTSRVLSAVEEISDHYAETITRLEDA